MKAFKIVFAVVSGILAGIGGVFNAMADEVNPKTGDNNSIGLYIGIAIGALALIAGLVFLLTRKPKKPQEKLLDEKEKNTTQELDALDGEQAEQ